jgi:hypothetical protein
VDTPLAGFDPVAESVDVSLAAFGCFETGGSVEDVDDGSGKIRCRGSRTGMPAAFRYPLIVSRRIPVSCWIRRRGHPSFPRAIIWMRFSVLKTLLMSAEEPELLAAVNVPFPHQLAAFEVSTTGRFWVSAGAERRYRGSSPEIYIGSGQDWIPDKLVPEWCNRGGTRE